MSFYIPNPIILPSAGRFPKTLIEQTNPGRKYSCLRSGHKSGMTLILDLSVGQVLLSYLGIFDGFFSDLFTYFERAREHKRGEGQRERENPQADSPPSVEPDVGLDLTTLRS